MKGQQPHLSSKSVTVKAPARLHLGFMDMNGGLGRNFGGLGLTLAGLSTHLTVKASNDVTANDSNNTSIAERAIKYAKLLLEEYAPDRGVHIEIHEAIPSHAGLGSGTQLGLAVCSAISHLFDLDIDVTTIAKLTARGARSGIGVGAFQQGGFIVDGGRGGKTIIPPVICRMEFPEQWRIILIFDNNEVGLNGSHEKLAFKKLPPMDPGVSGNLCRTVLMRILPALVESNIQDFGKGITNVQERVGDYFANYQGGRYSSDLVADALTWMDDQGVAGVGQSSWGPTGFALVENELEANRLVKKAAKVSSNTHLSFKVCQALNTGATIEISDRVAKTG
ncbi:MAG: beta-ribofuranosylaminobenzene 5'-phosphate synthase family protein [Gammaproteobacteria bacterium]